MEPPKSIMLFICPNADGFHPKGEYTEYLIIPQARIVESMKDTKKGTLLYYFVERGQLLRLPR